MTNNHKPLEQLDALLTFVMKNGADAADAVMFHTSETQASCRKGKPEGIERAENAALGLRAWVGARQAVVSSTDMAPDLLNELAERVVAMARASTEDTDSTLAPEALLARNVPSLDLYDGVEPDTDWLLAQCREAEDAALSVPGIRNSEGADAGYSSSVVALATRSRNGGFSESYLSSHFSLSVSVLAGEGTAMERDYDYASVRHRADLPSAHVIGASAAKRTLVRLHPRKMPTAKVSVVFDPRVGRSLLSNFAGAINGAAIARGTSFLKEALHTSVFRPGITIVDDPHVLRGLGSRPYDAEGVQNGKRVLVESGVLNSWLLDVRTANKLKLQTTGNASRSIATAPSPSSTNLYMQPGDMSPQALMADITQGFYVTETFGMGVNLITGDYSQGASGFWIESGAIAWPVSEVTVAGNLKDMFQQLTPANDLEFRYATNAPTLRIDGMTVAGT